MQPDRSFSESGSDETARSDKGVAEKETTPDDFWTPKKRDDDISPRDWAVQPEPPRQEEESRKESDEGESPSTHEQSVSDAQRRIQELLGTFSSPPKPAPTNEPLSKPDPVPSPPVSLTETRPEPPRVDPSPEPAETIPKFEGPGPVKIAHEPVGSPLVSDPEARKPSIEETQAINPTPVTPAPATSIPSVPPPIQQPAIARYQPYTRGRVRRLSQTINKVHPWSVLKLSLLFYFSVMLVFTFAVMILYYAADAAGIISNLESFIQGIGWADWTMGAGTVLRVVILIGVVNTVFWSAINVLVAFLYNLVSDIVGGIQVTATEREL